MTRPFNPRSAALAYRIWAYCTPRGWNCTVSEVAEELGEKTFTIKRICEVKNWTQRMRRVDRHVINNHGTLLAEVSDQWMFDNKMGVKL